MIAALATSMFLVAAWAAVSAVIAGLDDSGTKIIAALKGRSPLAQVPVSPQPVARYSVRFPVARPQPVRTRVEWRAAA